MTMIDQPETEPSSLQPLTRACRRALAQALHDLEAADDAAQHGNDMGALGGLAVVEPVLADVLSVIRGLLALRRLNV